MIPRSKPHLVIEVRLVNHGYQIDLFDFSLATQDGQNVIHTCECHDFSDSQPSICRRAAQMSKAILQATKKVQ